MKKMELDRLTPAADKRQLHQQVLLVTAFAGLTLLAMLAPIENIHIPLKDYLPLHTLLEFVSIVAAFLVFATVWHTPAKESSATLQLIAMALFAAGWLDFFHTLSFKGMPELMTPASPEKAISFWLTARLVVAVTLLGVSFYPQLPVPATRARYGLLAAFAVFNLLVLWGVIFHEADLPDLYIENVGLTALKRGCEWFITGLMALSAWRFYRLARQSDNEIYPWIFGAASIAALSELFFLSYQVVSDVHSLLGHLYKLVSYSLLYRSVFVVSVHKPYQQLARQTQALLKANETLRTQSLALESIVNPVVVANLQGTVLWRNPASHALLPTPSPDLENRLSLFLPPITPNPQEGENIRAVVQAGNTWRGLVHLKDVQSNNIIMDRTVTPLRNEDSEIEGYVSVAENVTDKTMSQLRHKRVLDTAIDGFWITDITGRMLEVNDAYARMSGYSVDELLSMHISQLRAIEQPEEVRARLQRIIEQGYDQFETRHRHKLGHEFSVDVSATYDPETKHVFVFLRDRSERVLAAAVRQDLERQLQQSQKVQALGQLTGGIAHDFNNILAAILGYSNLALDRFAPDKQGKLATYLREVITASERARDLIAKMLTFTRTQTNTNADVISPADVIEEVLAMMRPSLPSSIQLKVRIEDRLNIRMDAGELNQVLINLIINARDAIDGHGLIDIRLHQVQVKDQICSSCLQRMSGTYLALEVSDNGSGIAPEHLPRLFDPFFTTKDVGKGTGLGLSMVQGILRRADGHVVVESQPGRGSRFRLLLPIASPIASLPAGEPGAMKVQSGMGQHIWVVDDEPAVVRYMGELLEDWGYRVRLFSSPADVLAAVEVDSHDVDLIITDQTMPGMSGLALAQQLHRLRPDLPIILCTGYSDGIDPSDVLQNGIRRFFNKPVPAHELLEAVAHELEQIVV